MKETPPDGETFAKIVKNILNREELWNSWKNDGCPGSLRQKYKYIYDFTSFFNSSEIKKVQSAPIESPEKKMELKKPLLGDIIKEANSQGRYYMGR